MITGRGRFRKHGDVEGCLEISARSCGREERLQSWIHESNVVLPALQAMVNDHGRARALRDLLLAVRDLRHRVDAVERELSRLVGPMARS